MILFLNFAPIEFLGGAEQWIYQTAQHVNTKEKAILVSVSSTLSNLYSRLVLKRSFDKRITSLKDVESYSLTLRHFIPFTKEYTYMSKLFLESRLIYIRYEFPEVLIALYFGGIPVLKKLIAGLHSSILYQQPLTIIDYLHNSIYSSWLSKFILSRSEKVHVINQRDEQILKERFHLQNVVYIPTCVNLQLRHNLSHHKAQNRVFVLFVGELTMRKGVDILIDVIKHVPKNVFIHIAGNGPMEEQVKMAVSQTQQAVFHGHLDKKSLHALYEKCDILFLPSRAEGFPLVFHEAMAHGLKIIDSPFCNVGLPDYIEKATSDNTVNSYITLLSQPIDQTSRKKIQDYYQKHFNYDTINHHIDSMLFSL